MKMKIEINNSLHTLDVSKALSAGVLIKDWPLVKSFHIQRGAVFKNNSPNNMNAIILIQSGYCDSKFSCIGYNNRLSHYSNSPLEKEQMKDYLNDNGWHYADNINEGIELLLNKMK